MNTSCQLHELPLVVCSIWLGRPQSRRQNIRCKWDVFL